MNPERLSHNDLHQLKWLMGTLLSLIAMWTLFSLNIQSELLLIPGSVLVATVLAFPRLPGRIPPVFWKAMTPILVLVIVADFAMNRGDFLSPLVRMITLLLLLRCLSYRSRREDLQLILLSLFMAVISGVLTLSLVFAVQIALYTPIAMFLLFVVNLLESSRDERLTLESWDGFSWGRFIRRMRRVVDWKLASFAGGLFALMVAVSSLIFVVMPRFRFDQAIPFLQMNTSSLTGFSDSIELGGVTDIVEDNRVALRLDAPGRDAIPINPYFRMLVLDYYSDGNFAMSQSVKGPRWLKGYERNVLNVPLVVWLPRNSEGMLLETEDNVWTFYLEGGISKYLPVLGPFQFMRFQKIQEFDINEAFLSVNLDSATNSVFSYQVHRMKPTETLAANPTEMQLLRDAKPILAPRSNNEVWNRVSYPESLLAVPLQQADIRYVRDLVNQITGGAKLSFREFSDRLIGYLHANHSYSLTSRVSARGRDKVVAWLQDGMDGHCEYFAGAFTVLARAAGFPTRVVVGFNGGSWNSVEDYFVVRNRNAHAWCEIYDGDGTWHRVDPTPSAQRFLETGLAGNMRSLPEIGGWEGWVDSLRILWYRSIVNFDEQSQEALVTRLRSFSQEFGVEMKNTAVEWGRALREWARQPFTWQRALLLVGIALLFVLMYLAYLQRFVLRNWLLQTGWGRKLVGNRPDPVRRRAGRLLQRYGLAMDRADRNPDLWDETSQYRSTLVELQSLRFGDLSNLESAPRIFKEARDLIRKAARG